MTNEPVRHPISENSVGLLATKKISTRLLVVDAQEVVQQGLTSAFGGGVDGFEIISASAYDAALKIINETDVKVVIVDIAMSGREGIDFIKDIYALRRDLPIIVYTMRGEAEFGLRAIKCGAWAYVKKSDSLLCLKKAVTETLNGRKYVTPELAQSLMSLLRKDSDRPPHEALSDRELDVLRRLGDGQTIKYIAAELCLSVKTVSTYRARILEKLEMKGLADLVRYCVHHDFINPSLGDARSAESEVIRH